MPPHSPQVSMFSRCDAGFLLVLGCVVALPTDAHAYLDPGTGGFVLQVIAGAFLAAGVTARMWWGKLKSFLSRKHPESDRADRTGH